MKSRYGLLSSLTAAILFILLETSAVLMVTHEGVVQRFKVLGAVRSVESWFWERTASIRYYFNFRTENDRLTAENLQLRQQLSQYAALQRALDTVEVTAGPEFTYYGATVVKNSVNRQHNFLILDRGREDGIEEGMGVVTARGVVGVVSAVSRHYSYVISLLNTDQSVSARLAGSGTFGPMAWTGVSPRSAVLREIPVHIQAAPGDTVYSSGFSTLYPPDIPLGTVTESMISQGSSQEMSVELFEDFRSIRNVYIVRDNRRQELEELYEQAR